LKNRFTGLLILLVLLCCVGCTSEQPVPPAPPVFETTEEAAPEMIPESPPTESPPPELPATSPEPLPEESPAPTPEEPSQDAEISPETDLPASEESTVPDSGQNEPSETEDTPSAEPAETLPADNAPSQQLPILMYHHVVPDGTACNDMTVTVSKLAQDFRWLTEHGYETILPSQLISGETLPEKPVLITFDDGYRSNYDLAFPLFREYGMKAVISIMVFMQDHNVSTFMSWDMCREMADSGLVEIGSHTYRLHNLDERNGSFTPGGINGIQRSPDESDESFQARVLADLQLSHDLIEANLGRELTFFAYPFGIREADAEALIHELFPVTVVTLKGTADLSGGTRNLNRWTVTMNTDLANILSS
jgi:biofilm PGA synthesis lipoprotein PgaB